MFIGQCAQRNWANSVEPQAWQECRAPTHRHTHICNPTALPDSTHPQSLKHILVPSRQTQFRQGKYRLINTVCPANGAPTPHREARPTSIASEKAVHLALSQYCSRHTSASQSSVAGGDAIIPCNRSRRASLLTPDIPQVVARDPRKDLRQSENHAPFCRPPAMPLRRSAIGMSLPAMAPHKHVTLLGQAQMLSCTELRKVRSGKEKLKEKK